MIYIDDNIWNFDLRHALDTVSPWRRDYALRYRRELDQRLCVAVYRLLQHALLTEYGLDIQPRFIYNAGGKPALEGYPDVYFSLSHCPRAVACAVGELPVGIDVEVTDGYTDELARHVMSHAELRTINSSARPAVTFTRLWTMKESLYKLRGVPLAGSIPHMLDHTDRYRFTTLVHADSIITTTCTMR